MDNSVESFVSFMDSMDVVLERHPLLFAGVLAVVVLWYFCFRDLGIKLDDSSSSNENKRGL